MSRYLRFAFLSTLLTLSLAVGAQTGEVIVNSTSGTAGVVVRATSDVKPDIFAVTGSALPASGFVIFNSANEELLRVRSDSVLVLGGASASAWDPVVSPAIEYKNTAIAFGDITDLHFLSNAFYRSPHPNAWRYKVSDNAANYYMFKGSHYWRVAPSGTAGTVIPWLEAMNLSSAGNLGIGISYTAAQARVQIAGGPTALSLTTDANNFGFGVHFRDVSTTFPYGSGVLMDMQGNSVIRVSGIQIGDLSESEVQSTAAGTPLYLNRDNGNAVQIGGGGARGLISADTSTPNPLLLLRVANADGYYPEVRFAAADNTRIGALYAYRTYGVVIQANAVSSEAATFIVSPDGNVGMGKMVPAPGMRLDVVGNAQFSGTVTGGNIQAKYQDVAEWVPATTDLAPGTVVVLDRDANNTVRASSTPYDTGVAGVVSEQPGLLLGEAGGAKEMVATTGRVRVRVDATRQPIAIGDLLVTSGTTGVAMKSMTVDVAGISIHRPGTIIGKALEPLSSGVGDILVLLSLQ